MTNENGELVGKLSKEEIDSYNEKEYRINSQPSFKLNIPKK